jgi:hypothetical protein
LNRLDTHDLLTLEIDSKYYLDRPADREKVLSLVDEITAWRELGDSPEDVFETIEAFKYEIDCLREELNDFARAEAARHER